LQSNNHISLFISCTPSSGPLLEKAEALAEKLHLPFFDNPLKHKGIYLIYTDHHLELRENLHLEKTTIRPLFIDFIKGKNGYRRLQNPTINQPLARAVGIKPGFRPSVLDGTAGLGGDGYALACLGCNVTMVERSHVLGALLEDGLERGLNNDGVGKIIRERLTLIVADTREILKTIFPRPFSIYLDPMYPKRRKSALNKIEMRILRALVGDDLDGPTLLHCALERAVNRVVVKRPKEAPILAGSPPTRQILMKSSRFDVYMVDNT